MLNADLPKELKNDANEPATSADTSAGTFSLNGLRTQIDRISDSTLSPLDLLGRGGLSKTVASFSRPKGANLIGRTDPFGQWISDRARHDAYQYTRTLHGTPVPVMTITTEQGRANEGINFASQDYLSLCSHPEISEVAIKALQEYGPHSAGTSMLLGNTPLSIALEEEISDFVKMKHVMLFPTGWGAGFGTVVGLVRAKDYILMDEFAHACLRQGAYAATPNVKIHKHLNWEMVREQLKEIRSQDADHGILVITEGLFSMDTDSPNLRKLQEVCREYNATLLVDVAHDLGPMGPEGASQIAAQGMLGEVDLVMGAFSKSFASNGGFLATNSSSVRNFLKWNGGPHIFSNSLSPVQCAVIRKSIQIIRSSEGDELRRRSSEVVNALRTELTSYGLPVIGDPSPIVPILVGAEKLTRVATTLCFRRNVFVNPVEFPAVNIRASRFRLQVMANHTVEQARTSARIIHECIEEAKTLLSDLEKVTPIVESQMTH